MSLNNVNDNNFNIIVTFANCTNNQIQLKANIPLTFLAANKARIYALIMNNSTTPVTLILGTTNNSALGQGIVVNPGGNYEINQSNLYIGPITALSSADCKLSFVEGS